MSPRLFCGAAVLLLAVLGATTASAQYVATQVTNDYTNLDISTTGTDQTANVVQSGSTLPATDEGEIANVAIGFSFPFYGATYTTLNISVNGFLTFSPITGSTYSLPSSTPNASIPNNYIAGAWFDGGGSAAWPTGAKIYTQQIGTSPNAEFRVQFVNWPYYNNTGSNSFIYRLMQDGSIEVHYGTCDVFAVNGAITAVEDSAGSNGTASAGGFMRFTTPTMADRFAPPQNPTCAPSSGSAFTGSTTAGFDATVDAGVTLSGFSLDCDDPNDPTIDATITTSGAAAGVTQPSNVTTGAVPFSLAWTGTPSTPGTYTYTVVLDDGSLQTTFDVRITVTDPTPAIQTPSPVVGSSPILITEFTTNTGSDEFEIQNVSAAPFDATGWQVIISDSYTSIDTANSIVATLGNFTTGQTVTYDDSSASAQYWGNNILWDPSGTGWIMVVDTNGTVQDFVAFEWTATDIAGMSVTAGGFTGLNPGNGWSGDGVTDNGNVFARVGTGDNNDASDWQDNGSTNSWGTTNSGMTLPFSVTAGATLGGSAPNWTGQLVVGDNLGIIFTAVDSSSTQTLTYTVTVTGGTLSASAAGFNQTFTTGVYNDPSPGVTPHTLTLDGTAAAVGTIDLSIQVSDGSLTDTISYSLTIDPPPPAEINIQNASSTDVLTGTTDTIGTSIPVGYAQNYSYTIQNLDIGTLNLTSTPAVIDSAVTNCNVTVNQPANASIAGNGSENFSIDVTPTTSSVSWSVQLTIANNDSNENPYVFNVTGNAYDPTPEIDVQRPAGSSIASGSTENVSGTYNAVSTTLTYTIENQDLGDLVLSGSPRVALSNQSNCTVSLTTPPASPVAYNGTTTFVLTLQPTAAATWSFDVSIANNDSNEDPYTYTVTGTAAPTPAPEIDIQRPLGTAIASGGTDSVTGSLATVTTTLTYQILNTGNATLNLTGTPTVVVGTGNNCAAVYNNNAPTSVAQGSSATFGIDVTPAGQGNWSVTVSIDNDDANENPYTWTIDGTAGPAPAPEIDVQRPAGTSIASGGSDSVAGTVAASLTTLTYTIANTGNLVLNITGNPTISAMNNCNALVGASPPASVAATSSSTFTINVTPSAQGNWSFNVSLPNDDSNENPYTWSVAGSAQATPAPEIDVQRPAGSSIASGGTDSMVNFTTMQTLTYTIENQGSLPLNITGVTPVTIGSQNNCTALVSAQPAATVAVGATTTFDVQVTPPTSGTFSFTISIVNDDPNENPYVINFSGNTGSGTSVSTGGGGGGGGGGCAADTGGSYAWLLLALLAIPAVYLKRRKE